MSDSARKPVLLTPASPETSGTAEPAFAAGAGASLGRVLGAEPATARWRVAIAGRSVAGADLALLVPADASVDPALLREAVETGARVLLEPLAEPPGWQIVGVLMTARAVTIDRADNVDARVRNFRVTASNEALVRTAASFVRLRADEIELYGDRVVSRARDLVKLLGRMIKLN